MKHRADELQGDLLDKALNLCCTSLYLGPGRTLSQGVAGPLVTVTVSEGESVQVPFRPGEDGVHFLWLQEAARIWAEPVRGVDISTRQDVEGWRAMTASGHQVFAHDMKQAVVRAFLVSRLGEEVDL